MLAVMTKLANTTKDNPDISRQMEDIYNFERRLAEVNVCLCFNGLFCFIFMNY